MNRKRRIKELFTCTLAVALLAAPLALSLPANPAEAAAKAKYAVTQQPFSIEGAKESIGTFNNNGTTYIALRHLSNGLGLAVNFDKAAQAVKISGKHRMLTVNLNNSAFTLNGQPVLGPELIVQDNTTYLPLRFILAQMGYEVGFEPGSKLIAIHAIQENDLKINAEVVGADGDGKSLLVYYPVISGFANGEVQQKINAFLKQEADRNIAAGSEQMDLAVKGNNDMLALNPQAEIRQPSFDGRYTVTYNEKGRLSLYVDYYVYFGGAHGNTARVAYTFDLATGQLLSLQDVAKGNANYVSIINQTIKEQIQSRRLPLSTPFDSIEPDRDFFLNRNGVVIYFTQYEYTAYAEGMPEFVIPYTAF